MEHKLRKTWHDREEGEKLTWEELVDLFVDYLRLELKHYNDGELPRNWAKALLIFAENLPERKWGWSWHSTFGSYFHGIPEWDELTPEEARKLANDIYYRIVELAKKEEEWAGLSVEEWIELFKEQLIKKKKIKGKGDWIKEFWDNWLEYYRKKRFSDMYIMETVLEGIPDWDWMPADEAEELTEEVMGYIYAQLKEMGVEVK